MNQLTFFSQTPNESTLERSSRTDWGFSNPWKARFSAFCLMFIVSISANSNVAAQYLVPPPSIPPVQQELITIEPSAGHVWIPGTWEREAENWDWVAGRWEQPPHETAHWVGGYWKMHDQGYHWHEGHWALATVGMVVKKPITVPALVQEVVPPAPASGATWVPGRWEWRAGAWVWVAGYYIEPPHPQAKWVAGNWARGELGFYRWIPGHWAK